MSKRRHRKWLVHFIAQCDECGWNTQDFAKGQELAMRHAHKTGHAISGEEGYAVRYASAGRGEGKS